MSWRECTEMKADRVCCVQCVNEGVPMKKEMWKIKPNKNKQGKVLLTGYFGGGATIWVLGGDPSPRLTGEWVGHS